MLNFIWQLVKWTFILVATCAIFFLVVLGVLLLWGYHSVRDR